MFNGRLRADLLFSGDLVALRAMHVLSKHSLVKSDESPGGLGCLLYFASMWMKAGSGGMKCGRSCVRDEELICNAKGLAPTPGVLRIAVALRKE